MVLNELLAAEGITDESDVEHIHLLVGDWQLLADLSFADLVLWVPSPTAPTRSWHMPDRRPGRHCSTGT
jgi:hypothetical protein